MNKNRLEAFSDGVIAIIITIMVLSMQRPRGATLAALKPVLPALLSYTLSFVYVGIYWNNHHHLLSSVTKIDGRVLWPNLLLLFWLSLVPFATDWMGESHFAPVPLAVYGVVLCLAALSFLILQHQLIVVNGACSPLARAVARSWKGRLSLVGYTLAIVASFWHGWAAEAMYVAVALGWLVPDRRIERALANPFD
ncbi:TMEM175 family protein [Hymenobacter fodinae]|uniref:DUF1211 domain-containing protein n=1 Tax=Hymenobacter fodinae TaxID=2510796 RepID=A0A4Z0P7Q9_9BACT|nr:TMEM175 family protein [Hymenobacter fodinae]TGE08383.1 DUF1211 domain-containing protein [Hymenobacter fodinae]